ncbi:MAG: hypothetical protein CMJ18_09845 [Phycisphaeraceae bacterium]|nr:hypothetical protein [Phycisphaeraceae bacterium]
MNNFVTELAAAEGLGDGTHRFVVENPRTGWMFFRSEAATDRSGSVEVSISAHDIGEKVILEQGPHALRTLESMQRLKKGPVTVEVEVRNAEVRRFEVRLIPAILYDHWPTSNKLEAYGEYSWEFLEREGLLASMNTVSSWAHWVDGKFDFDGENSDVPRPWLVTGRHRIGICSGLQTGETAYRFWSTALSRDDLDGVIIDEFYPKLSKHFPDWVKTLKRVTAEQPDKPVYLYLAGGAKDLRPFVEPLADTGAYFVLEVYTDEKRTEKEMLEDSFGVNWTKSFEEYFPGFTERCVHAIGFMSGAASGKDSGDIYPGASYKVLKDVQFQRIATDPALRGLGGVGNYNSIYIDEEYMRWYGRLLRHYCIEGNTERLTGDDPYELPHIANPDFETGLDGWTIEPAEPESIEVRHAKGYGIHVQGRHKKEVGDHYLWMKRSAEKPNVITQEIRDLEPGRHYSVRFYTTDLKNMHEHQVHHVYAYLQGDVREVPSETIHDAWIHAPTAAFGNKKTFPNYHRIVFRANATTAKLRITDWRWVSLPTAPVGQELMLNFIQVEPYLMPAVRGR